MKGNRDYLIDYLYDNVRPTELTIEECADDIIDILVSEKYKWHDLRKDPEDLPKVNPKNTYDSDVLLVVEYAEHPERGRNIYKGHLKDRVKKCVKNADGKDNFWGIPTYDTNWTIWGWSYFDNPKVIAWRDIEPFKG